MKIYILLAHPDKDTFNGKLADTYEKAALQKGHEVRRQNLGDLNFDPTLWKGYKVIQQLEPDLRQAQDNIQWCHKWVIIYPIWWGNQPALLKGFLDRVLLPGFAFKHHEKGPWWDKLLTGKSAHIITTCDAPNIWIWWQYRNSDINALKRATLEYCGMKPVKVTRISRLRFLSEAERMKQVEKVVNSIE